MDQLRLTRPDDWHLHLRDGDAMRSVLPHSARQFARAIVMPNLKPPITTVEAASAYRARIVDALPRGASFEPLMTLYLTDGTSPDDVRRAKDSGFIHGIKLYPAGATTHSAAGVTNLRHCWPALETMQAVGMPLLVHGEVTDPAVDLFDRERVFIDEQLIPLRAVFPNLRIVFEHITTRDAVDYVTDCCGRERTLAATITAHHLLYNRNAIFIGEGGAASLRPHWYCLPVLKRETHRQALVGAATSGKPCFFLGTDSAPHSKKAKETACCGAGCFTAFHAIELYAEAFDRAGGLDRLEGFASFFGADFYGLPRNVERITLKREAWTIPDALGFGDETLVPLDAGATLKWRMVD